MKNVVDHGMLAEFGQPSLMQFWTICLIKDCIDLHACSVSGFFQYWKYKSSNETAFASSIKLQGIVSFAFHG